MVLALLSACDGGGAGDQANPARQPDVPENRAAPLPPPPPSPAEEAAGSQEQVAIAAAGTEQAPTRSLDPSLLPLERILKIAQRRVAGEVIDVELEDDDGTPEYEITILTADSRSIEMKIDARSGTIRELEED